MAEVVNLHVPKNYKERRNIDPNNCLKLYRFSEERINWMADYFLEENFETQGGASNPEQQMRIFLRYTCDPGYGSGVAEDIGVHQSSISRHVSKVSIKIIERSNEWIKFPTGQEETIEAIHSWQHRGGIIPSTLAAIDCKSSNKDFSQDKKRHGEHFMELTKQYGDLFCMRVGFRYILVVNSIAAAKETHGTNDAFTGCKLPILKDLLTRGKGIITAEGQPEKNNRRFLTKVLRDFNFGKIKMEGSVLFEVEAFLKEINDLDNITRTIDGYDINQTLSEYVMNTMTAILFSKRFNKTDVKYVHRHLKLASQISPIVVILDSFPWLMKLNSLPIFKSFLKLDALVSFRKPLQDFVADILKEHHENYDENNLSDIMYQYIFQQKKHVGSADEYWWDDEQIMHVCTELMVAGIETTKNIISHCLNLLSLHPEFQQRVQEEIDRVTGGNRTVQFSDQVEMPLLEATIQEVLRTAAQGNQGIPIQTKHKTNVRNWMIPEGTFVLTNFISILRDPCVWKRPYNFEPDSHFLSEDNKTVINRDKNITFFLGRRSCIGEPLARMEIFLYLANILQNYSVTVPQTVTDPSEMHIGLFRFPKNFRFIFEKRIVQ